MSSLSRKQLFAQHSGDPPNARTILTRILNDGNTVANYQPGIGVTGTLNASAWANQIGAAGPLVQASGASQPIVLPFTGQKYAYLSGVAANFFTSPSSAVSRITGSIDVRVLAALDSWTPGSSVILLSKANYPANQGSYNLFLSATGILTFELSPDGTAGATAIATCSTATGLAAAALKWIRVTWNQSTKDVIFYLSDDAVTWTQLGTTQTANIASIFSASSDLSLGAFATGGNQILGKIYRVQVYSGISGTLAVDFNAADWPETSTNGAIQASSTTGEVWTLNNTGTKLAQIVGSPQLLFDGVAHYLLAAFTLNQPCTYYFVINTVTWTNNDYVWDGTTLGLANATQAGSTPNITFQVLAASPTLNTYNILTGVANGASSIFGLNGTETSGGGGAGNPAGLTLCASGNAATFCNAAVKEVIIRNVSDSAATRVAIQAYLKTIHRTP